MARSRPLVSINGMRVNLTSVVNSCLILGTSKYSYLHQSTVEYFRVILGALKSSCDARHSTMYNLSLNFNLCCFNYRNKYIHVNQI